MTTFRPLFPTGPLRIALVIGLLALANLACFTINHTVVYDQDGSGAGVVLLEMTLPRSVGDKSVSFEDAQEIKAGLEEQGWEDVSVTELDAAHYLATGKFHFGAGEGDKALSDVLPGYTLKAEAADNDYVYYTFEGTADYTELESFWNTVQNDWAVNGIEITPDFFGFGSSDDKVELSAAEVQEMMATYGPPAASLRVFLPGQTPVEANQFWDNEDDFISGKSDFVTFSWKPGGRATAPLKVQRRLEPLTTVSAAEAQAQIDQLLTMYQSTIPKGKGALVQWWSGPLAGHINNNLSAFFNGDNFICSDYQERVLAWLNSIRTSPNDSLRQLLNGLDYGPIETLGGGHRAVVLFQRGTDWRTTGLVLDPWPYQEPRAFAIGSWSIPLWGVSEDAKFPYPDSESGKLYPHLFGKTSSYPASAILQGDLGKGLAKPTRIVFVRSPVTLLVTFTDGRRLGLQPDGVFVNDFGPGANLYTLPKDETGSAYEWYMFLPEGDFAVEVTGQGSGDFHVLIASAEGFTGYGPQPIQPGQTAAFSSNALGASPLTLPDGSSVGPLTLAPDQIDAAMGIPLEVTEAAPPPATTPVEGQANSPQQPAPTVVDLPGGLDIQMLIMGGLACLALAGLAALGASLVIGLNWLMKQRK